MPSATAPSPVLRLVRSLAAFVATLALTLLTACGSSSSGGGAGGGGGNEPEGGPVLAGFVSDAAGSGGSLAVRNALVRAVRVDNGKEVGSDKTDGVGQYNLAGLPADTALRVIVEPPALRTDMFGGTYGYFGTSRLVTLPDDQATRLDFALGSAKGYTFDPTVATTLGVTGTEIGTGPAQVELDADALVRRNGSAANGPATVLIQPIDVSADTGSGSTAGLDAFPGDMLATRTDDSATSIASFGAMTVSFFDSDNAPLQLAAGKPATIRIPVPAALQASAPATIELWWFDVESGLWQEEGLATLALDSSYYEGTVTHFTTWNADIPITVAEVSGTVQYADGSPAVGAIVRLKGVDYAYQRYSVIDSKGNFSLPARRDYSVDIEISYGDSRESFVRGPVPDAATFNVGTLVLAGNAPRRDNPVMERTFTASYDEHKGLYLAQGTVVSSDNWELMGGADLQFFVEVEDGPLLLGIPHEHGTGGGGDGYGIQYLDGTSFSELKTAPQDGYYSCMPWDTGCPLPYDVSSATPARDVFAIRRSGGLYSKLVIANVSEDSGTWTVTVRYVINTSGSRDL